jgi:hypothetical protein
MRLALRTAKVEMMIDEITARSTPVNWTLVNTPAASAALPNTNENSPTWLNPTESWAELSPIFP